MRLDINQAILEVIALIRSEVVKNRVSLQTQLAAGLPLIQGDRVQLQQVILNLIINALEAMSGVSEGLRELQIGTGKDASGGVLGGFELAGRAADAVPDLVVFLDGITRRGGNNDRLSTLW